MNKSTEVRFTVDSEYIDDLKKALGARNATDVAQEALTILKWAVDEKLQGRQIISADPEKGDRYRLVTPRLQNVKPG